ncbi:MAG: hypothetical protein ICV59_08080 [Thermoleophilia bacterium]|nr:hypothetical protein [Thermoleophilia bacterium]
MPFWRRRRPLHEQLAEGTGLLEWQSRSEPVMPGFRTNLDFLHGARPRRWAAVVTAEAPDLTGDAVHFAALPDGTLIVDRELPGGALEPLAAALEGDLDAPYRAEGVRQDDRVWAVAANPIDVVELAQEIPGDRLELAMHRGERALTIDGEPSRHRLPSLEAYAAHEHEDYVARAERLDGDLWEVRVSPL